ncbi:MAG: segregation and condensation protein A, partial [Acidimicrobiales bacterium]
LAEYDKMAGLDLEVATEFALIAATLIELKCRRLLPGRDDVDIDEEIALWEERDLLLARLLECKTFKDAALALARLAQQAGRSVARDAGPDESFDHLAPDVMDGVTPQRLWRAARAGLAPRAQSRVDLSHVAPITLSVGDAVAYLAGELSRSRLTSFSALTAGMVERIEVIVTFLALLEMYKEGMVELDQAGRLDELRITWAGSDDVSLLRNEMDRVEEYQG